MPRLALLKRGLTLFFAFTLTACPGEKTQSSGEIQFSRLSGLAQEKNLQGIGSKNRAGAQAFDPGNPDESARGGKTLMAVYLMGSDLESKALAGSKDMVEMLMALDQMSEREKENLDLIVGFGGAKKPGWEGIKYTTPDCMLSDLEDGAFGNADCYTVSDEAANMGDPQTLVDFLTYLKTNFPAENYGKTFLDLWDHGNAHLGYGPDENHGFPAGMMQLSQLDSALASYGEKFDLLGFDACLMGNLDVARYVREHAHFLLASEELEPGHGWNYTDVLNTLAKDPEISVVEIGKKLIDSFVTHPDHQAQGGKTLSLVNLNQYEAVAKALDGLSGNLDSGLEENFEAILEAASKSQGFGKHSKGDAGYSIDILHFLKLLKSRAEGIDTSALEKALKAYIMYSRHDGSRPHSQGAAVFSINNDQHYSNELYGPETSATPQWFSFVEKFLTFGMEDSENPEIAEAPTDTTQTLEFDEDENPVIDDYEAQTGAAEEPAEDAEEQEEGEEQTNLWMPVAYAQTGKWKKLNDPCADGFCFSIQDNKGLEDVVAVRVSEVRPNIYRFLSIVPALEIAQDIYRTPQWDGKTLHLCADADCKENLRTVVPMEYDEITDDDTVIYFADGTLNDEDVTFYFEIDEKRELLDLWAVPYEFDEKTQTEIVSREQWDLEEGDIVAFYIEEYNMENEKDDVYNLSAKITLTESADFYFLKAPGKLQTFLVAEDMNGNLENSPLQDIK